MAIRGGRIIDPANGKDVVGDLLIREGVVVSVGPIVAVGAATTIEAEGLIVSPGMVDVHCHLREPGFEHKETIATGTLAAARGGFTTLCVMPNTVPPVDNAALVQFVLARGASEGVVRVLPIGCLSRGRVGTEIADLAELAEAGAVGFSDDGSPVDDTALMRRALEYSHGLLDGELPVIDHCEDRRLSAGATMHEGWVSARLGLRGSPAAAEAIHVARDLFLAELTGARLHLAHLSTASSIELVVRAKERGLPISAEVTPHHITLDHEVLLGELGGTPGSLAYDTRAKVNPPLRTSKDVEACRAALAEGTIDCIATDHAPHAIEDKLCEFEAAAYGISGLETALALSLTLVHDGVITLPTLIERMTSGPVRTLALDRRVSGLGTLGVGAPGDVTVFDPYAPWVVQAEKFASKGKNTPVAGRTLRGRVIATIFGGTVVYKE